MILLTEAARIMELRGSSRWDREQARRFQARRLSLLVRHAWENVPYYREQFEAHGLRPESVRGLADLGRLPAAERTDMQQQPVARLVARGYDAARLRCWRTSGSSGQPFTIRRTPLEDRLLQWLRIRQLRRLGMRWTDVRTYSALGEEPARRSFMPFLRRAPVNILAPAREILDRLAEVRPDVLALYAGTLAWISGAAEPRDRERIRPRLIVPVAEALTPLMRRRIEEAFAAPVYDFYAAHEFNLIASECGKTGLLHLEETGVLVEVLKDGRPCAEGEAGEVHGTALHSFAMPFLRYRLGDIAVRGPDPCPCGAPCATLARVEGRSAERFLLASGKTLHPFALVAPVTREAEWVRQYQVVQEALDHVRVLVVAAPDSPPGRERLEELGRRLEAIAGVRVTLELTERIPRSPAGKYQPYYSKLRSER